MTVISPPGAAEDAPRVLLIDNYDSFTYNLAHLLCESGAVVDVRRHDAVTPDEADALAPTHLVVSPGPGRPNEAGVSAALIERFAGRVPVLGVCLGHQCIVEVYGGVVERARRLMHGKVGTVDRIEPDTLLAGLPESFEAGRYHSLVVDPALPDCLERSAWSGDTVMGIRHRDLPAEGVQFHPESVLTPDGKQMLRSFLSRAES